MQWFLFTILFLIFSIRTNYTSRHNLWHFNDCLTSKLIFLLNRNNSKLSSCTFFHPPPITTYNCGTIEGKLSNHSIVYCVECRGGRGRGYTSYSVKITTSYRIEKIYLLYIFPPELHTLMTENMNEFRILR
jgi:hypothetical protein